MKRVSLANLAINAPVAPAAVTEQTGRRAEVRRTGRMSSSGQVSKITREEDTEIGSRVQVAFRMDKDAYKDLKRMALDEDTTVNELMIRSINELRERKGLKKLSDQ